MIGKESDNSDQKTFDLRKSKNVHLIVSHADAQSFRNLIAAGLQVSTASLSDRPSSRNFSAEISGSFFIPGISEFW